jgi:hypothetical protein
MVVMESAIMEKGVGWNFIAMKDRHFDTSASFARVYCCFSQQRIFFKRP